MHPRGATLSSGIHFWSWKTEVFLALVIENRMKNWLCCIQGDLDVETGFWKSLFVLVCKCRVSRAGKGQKSNPVALVFRLLMAEAWKMEVVAVTMALLCLRQRCWCRWGCVSLTEVAKPPFFPKLAEHLERSNNSVKIIPPSFSLALSDTQRSVSHHL